MYDPRDGRFLQTDPIGYTGGLNLYTYCGNNPLNWLDPYGLIGIAIGGSGTAGNTPVGATGGGQLVIDHKGNVKVFIHGGIGGLVGTGAGAMVDVSVFGGTVDDLWGPFQSWGGSGGEGLGGGFEANLTDHWITKKDGKFVFDFKGSALTGSFGLFGGIPAELHSLREGGAVIDFITFLKKVWDFLDGDDGGEECKTGSGNDDDLTFPDPHDVPF